MAEISHLNVLSYLRKESLDIYNRLHSIAEDVEFVQQVHNAYPEVPLLPNLRCGAWYTNPDIVTDAPAYFKSTDGHFNNWSFNLRRANIHLLDIIAKFHSLILVDSTRSGKRIPDALSKTVPIWCSVINRALLVRYPELNTEESFRWDIALYTPPAVVSRQEHQQIEEKLDSWAQALAASSFHLAKLPRPLRPVWITPATTTFLRLSLDQNVLGYFLPVLCVSASKRVNQGIERRSTYFSYVQGSGDDHELWGSGLTPAIFWKHYRDLLSTDRAQLGRLVSRVVQQESALPSSVPLVHPTPVRKVGGRLLLCALGDLSFLPSTGANRVNYLILTPSTNQQNTLSRRHISVVTGKRGKAYFLTSVLPASIEYICERLHKGLDICVACETGRDLSVGVVVAALELFFEDNGSARRHRPTSEWCTNKQSIRTRLEWVITSRPQANPSRSTLKRVNEFLLTPLSLRSRLQAPSPHLMVNLSHRNTGKARVYDQSEPSLETRTM